MSRTVVRALCITLLLMLGSVFLASSQGTAGLSTEPLNASLTSGSTPANFTSAGGSGVALVGEPAHKGDNLVASILVSNHGSETGSVVLHLEDTINGVTVSGSEVEITSGSSREASVAFTPESNGSLAYRWWLTSIGAQVDSSLNGVFVVEVYRSQAIEASVESYDWSLEEGLSVDVSMILSPGRSRTLFLEISKEYRGDSSLMQSFTVELDPGRRSVTIELGHPEADSLSIELIPISWATAETSINSTTISLVVPNPQPSASFVVSSPEFPKEGESVLVEFSLSNDGNSATPVGKARLVHFPDYAILSETSVPSVPPLGSFSSVMEIPSWPDATVVEFDLVWMMGEESTTSFVSIESKVEDDGFKLPFDAAPAIYGILAGIASILAARVTWRTVSSRTASTAQGGLRAPRALRSSRGEQVKREVSCPHCEQRLNVPINHSGRVKCPACTRQFDVEDEIIQPTRTDVTSETETGDPKISDSSDPVDSISRSSDDLLQCPDCSQTLRVPIERRPIRSRCPVCKLEFLAEASEE